MVITDVRPTTPQGTSTAGSGRGLLQDSLSLKLNLPSVALHVLVMWVPRAASSLFKCDYDGMKEVNGLSMYH